MAGALPLAAPAQSASVVSLRPVAQANRIPASPDFGPQTQLTGHLPRWVSVGAQVSGRSVDTSASLQVTLVLQRDPAVQAAFEKLLADQQNPASPMYHQWLTPQQVGQLYGVTSADIAAVTSWLTAQGLTVDQISPSATTIDVHGSTAAISNAFRTSFAYFNLNGVARLSAVSEPSIPTALTSVVRYVHGLTEVPLRPLSYKTGPRKAPTAASSTSAATITPDLSNSNGNYYITPGDFAIIYDLNSVYNAGNKGATLGSAVNKVAIIGRSRVSATDISEYATNTGIGSSYTVNTIIPTNGTDPGPVCTFANAQTCDSSGTGGDQGEQTLDVDRVIGTAPAITADLVVSGSAHNQDGVYIAAAYEVNTVVDPVMTISYGSCEAANGSSGVLVWDNLFSAAAAEGISVFVSSGDSGANGCATSGQGTVTAAAPSINAICSSSYATCVGGTQFNYATNPSAYWTPYVKGGNNFTTALSYIPEGAWNEPLAGGTSSSSSGSGCENVAGNNAGGYCPLATGGGVSGYIAKPSWQTGIGVPADGARDVPDVSFSSSLQNGYYVCLDYELGEYASQGLTSANGCSTAGGGYYFPTGGTSAAAPSMAGVAALLNSKSGKAHGNLNPTLYSIASGTSGTTAFHDATPASSGVGCSITVPSMCNNSTPGSTTDSTTVAGGVQGYALTTGYDQATGLGSLDVANFLSAATVVSTISTTTAVTASPNPATTSTSVKLTATITPASGTASATGTVQFYANGVAIGAATTPSSNVATLNYTFSTGGTYAITAIFAGDSIYSTSTATAVSLVVTTATTPGFTISAVTPAISVVAGNTVTDSLTVTSTNGFAGTVTIACTPTTGSGNAVASSCTASPVTLTANGTATSSVTLTTAVAAGTINLAFTGTSGTTTGACTASPCIVATVTAPFSLNATASPASVSIVPGVTTATSTVTFTSLGYAGVVTPVCTITAGTCTVQTGTVTLAANGTATATVTISGVAGATGSATATVTGKAGSFTTTGSAVIAVTYTQPFTLSAPSLSFTAGATTGNTDTVTLTAASGFTGSVSLNCSISTSSAAYQPTCVVSPSPVTLTSGGTATSVVTISSHATVNQSKSTLAALGGAWRWSLALAAILVAFALRRKRSLRTLAVLTLLAAGISAMTGCGNNTTPVLPTSSAGSYTVTVNGTSGSTTETTTFSLTINQ